MSGAMRGLGSLLASVLSSTLSEYKPKKFCRTRRCTMPFGHKGNCDVAVPTFRPFHGRTPNRGRVTVHYRPLRSRRPARPSGVALASPTSLRGKAQRAPFPWVLFDETGRWTS